MNLAVLIRKQRYSEQGTQLVERLEAAFKTQVTFVTDDFAEVAAPRRFAKLAFGGRVR